MRAVRSPVNNDDTTDTSSDGEILTHVIGLKREHKCDELARFAGKATTSFAGRFMLLINLGIHARDAGLFDVADEIFLHVIRDDPSNGFVYYELAISHLLRGQHAEGLKATEKLLTLLPLDFRGNVLASRFLMATGSHVEADKQIDIAASTSPESFELSWLREFNRFLEIFPLFRALELCRSFENEPRFLQPASVIERIFEAVASRRPFSLIRLGDGEGAFVRLSEEDERQFPNLYRRNRLDRSHVWFKGEIDIEASGFQATAFGIHTAVQNADVVGIPYAGWIEQEYKIQSPTGISSLVNALRLMSLPDANIGQALTPQLIHLDLAHACLPELLRKETEIGLISCHSELPGRLQTAFGLKLVEFHKIPGEKVHRDIIGESAATGQHYPERFQTIMNQLQKWQDGRVFLVGAGLLGKFYCDQIKRNGGIGIDIGSLADAWMGANTRPGHEKLDLALAHGNAGLRDEIPANPKQQSRGKPECAEEPGRSTLEGAVVARTTTFESVIAGLWNGRNPYTAFPANLIIRDMQGWNSHHKYLTEAISETKASVVVEVGVWKGASSIHMAKFMRDTKHDGAIISVDTFLGSWDHWLQPEFFNDLSFSFGYPQLYYKFISNVIGEGVANYIVPLPLDSNNAFQVLSKRDIRPSIVHLDGGHDYEAVLLDLRRWWSLIPRFGQLIIDDYDDSGSVWPSVRDAVIQFRQEACRAKFDAEPYKARLIKT